MGMYRENLKDREEHHSSSVSVIDPIEQIYGYMGHNELQYTMSLARHSSNVLPPPVSPPLPEDDDEPPNKNGGDRDPMHKPPRSGRGGRGGAGKRGG